MKTKSSSKRIAFVATLLVMTILSLTLAACSSGKIQSADVNYDNHEGDAIVFTLPELEAYAELIAKVEVTDDLTLENSHITYADEAKKQGLGGFYSLRKIKVLETYKNDFQTSSESLSIRDLTAKAEDGSILTFNDNRPLVKGNQYIVFLRTTEGSNELGIISADNGVFEVNKTRETAFEQLRSEVISKFNR